MIEPHSSLFSRWLHWLTRFPWLGHISWVTAGLAPLFVVPVWAAGGTYKPWQGSFLWLCLFAWTCFFLQPDDKHLPPRRERLIRLLRDPVFWCAILFMGFLTWQWQNSGRIRVFDFAANAFTYSAPKHPGPWSVTPAESLEMLKWFGPVLTVLLILRHSWTRIPTTPLLWIVGVNGFLNALLSFVHQGMSWEKMYTVQPFGKDVYGSFGYPNHGAVYFILLFSIAMGLLLRELLRESTDRETPTLAFAALWTPVFFLAANLSTSRAGILGAWLVLLLSLASLVLIAWPRVHPVQRVYGLIAAGLLIGLCVTAFVLFAKPIHVRELQNATVHLNIYQEIEGRFFQTESAWRMWRAHPWFGVGGWGYRWFASEFLPAEQLSHLLGKGKANVHNDWMQYLAEFGIVGFGLLAGAFLPRVIVVVKSVFRRPTRDDSLWSNPLSLCAFWGLTMLLLDSQFDIPLRSPAVFIHGVLLLFLISPHPESPSLWPPVIDWKRLQPPVFGLKGRHREIAPEEGTDL